MKTLTEYMVVYSYRGRNDWSMLTAPNKDKAIEEAHKDVLENTVKSNDKDDFAVISCIHAEGGKIVVDA